MGCLNMTIMPSQHRNPASSHSSDIKIVNKANVVKGTEKIKWKEKQSVTRKKISVIKTSQFGANLGGRG